MLVVHGVFGGYDAGLLFARLTGLGGFRVIAPARFGYLGSTLPARRSPAVKANGCAALLDRWTRWGVAAGSPSTATLSADIVPRAGTPRHSPAAPFR